MDTPIDIQEYKGYTIEIHPDEEPLDPREDDNLGKMACFHKRYQLGDKHNLSSESYNSWDDFQEYLEKENDVVEILPLYLYDHSGITMSTSPFSCPWDSGQVGFIYATRKAVLENFCVKRITKEIRKKARTILEAEVKEYDNYLKGDVYGYVIKNKNGECVESCYGFQDEDGTPRFSCIYSEAKSIVDGIE